MIKELTELVFILDKSGSMGGLESDTIGGFNSMLLKQQKMPEECLITTVLFNHTYELLHDRINIKAIRQITEEEYQVSGTTALLDAIGRTIHKISNAQKHTREEFRAEKILFVIITDGLENSSREYSVEAVKASIETCKSQFGWEFIFMGANIDAVEAAATIGISADRAQNYHADKIGVKLNFMVANEMCCQFREQKGISENWNESIQKDFSRRGKKK